VLGSVARQRQAPHEIVIADDGSGAATQTIIAGFLAGTTVASRLVSQPHHGFRAARLRNLAIAASSGDYLVFIDGDMLLHPEFVADHARHARRGHYTQGVRVQTSEWLTRGLVAGTARWPTPLSRGVGLLRRAYLVHSVRLAGLGRNIGNGLVALKSCNQGFWRDDLVKVNGFDEDFVGWGPEDKELCARLEHAGIRRQTLLCGGIACHLRHPPAARARLAANLALLERTRRERRIRCIRGVDAHLPPQLGNMSPPIFGGPHAR
jgi:glycosyltransferase involved in cell wall biosynthesis